MEELKGTEVAKELCKKIKEKMNELRGYIPHLAIVRVGERPDDLSYERGAVKRMEKLGITTSCYSFVKEISNEEFQHAFADINDNPEIDGILVLRPLPKQIDEKAIESMIDPSKDVDCISPRSLASIFSDEKGFAPCTAQAVMEMIEYTGIDLTGKRAVVLGRSMVVGKPLAMLLLQKNATVTICHSKSKNLPELCQEAEILAVAVGRAGMVNQSYIGNHAAVFDVGINLDEQGKLCGDCDFDSVSKKALIATPVPGGVGSVTTSVLALHVVESAFNHRK